MSVYMVNITVPVNTTLRLADREMTAMIHVVGIVFLLLSKTVPTAKHIPGTGGRVQTTRRREDAVRNESAQKALERGQLAWYPPCQSESNGPSPPGRAIGGVGGAEPPGQ